jgi:hypothetical protein
MRRLIVNFSAFALLISSGGCSRKAASRQEDPEVAFIRMAVRAVDEFHAAVSSKETARVCNNAEPHAFDQVTKLSCAEYLGLLNSRLGAFVDSKRTQTPLASAQPAIVGLVYQSRYQHGDARERFTYRIEAGRTILTLYRVTSDLLSR